jgi:hypothetical protein
VFGDQFLKIINQFFLTNDMSAPPLMKGVGGRECKQFLFNEG